MPQKDHIYKGIAHGCMAFFLLTIMNMFVKLLVDAHHIIEIAFYRNAIPAAAVLAYIGLTKKTGYLKAREPKALTLRVMIGTIGLFLTFGAVKYLPLSDATVLFFVSTLIAPVLAVLILKEYMGPHRWTAVIIGFSGVLLIAQPQGDFALLGTIIALGAALCHALVQIMLRYLKQESSVTVALYFMLGGATFSALFMPLVGKIPTPLEAMYLLGLGISGGTAQYFLTSAFRLAPASVIIPFNYTGLIWATGLDILIWHYIPGWPVFLGSAIIIAAKLYIIYRERKSET